MTRDRDRYVPTAAQLAAQSRGDDAFACLQCGCRASEVLYTRQPSGFVKRVRVCLNKACRMPRDTEEHQVPPGFKVVVVPEDEEELEEVA